MPPDMALNMRHSKLKAAEAALLAGELKKPTWESRNEGIHERVSFEDSIWGFDLAGGAYYKTPLRVVAVKRDSRADKAGIRVGDKLTRINDIDTSTLTIQEAHTMIIDSGVHLRIAVSAPEDEEDSYHCYEDPIDEAYDSEEERLREEEEARRRQVHAKVSSYWSLQWPWVSKRRVIYRESNCFMVPSKYEKSHSEKFSPQQSVITQDDIVLQSTKSEKEMKNVINNESEQTNKPLVNGHELPTLNGNGHIQNGDQPQQSIPNGNLDNKKLISNGHVNNLNDLVGIPEDEESMQDEGNVEIVSQNNEMVVADDEVNNESLKYNNEVAQTIDENFSSQLDGMTEADDDMMIINELLDDNNDDMHKIDEDITPQMNGMTEADDGIINEVLEKNNGTVHENKEDVSFQVNRSIGTDNEVINDIENNHEVSNEVDEDEILNSILSDNVIQNSESMEER